MNKLPAELRLIWQIPFLVLAVVLFSGCERAPSGMVEVARGEFIMGTDEGEPDEGPQRKISLKGFYIDRFPVTNSEYRRFVKDTKHAEPKDWTVYGYQEEKEDHPVVFVSFSDASGFCKWAGKRLPIETEWEKAARGADGRTYPWGSTFDASRANTSIPGIVGTTSVRRYDRGQSPYGAWDMAGNVWEWTATDYDKRTKVVKGGSWGLSHRFARTFSRVGYGPESKVNNLGFRCAKDNE